MDAKELRKNEIEKEINALNIQMKAMKFERLKDSEKSEYIEKEIALFTELKTLSGFVDQIKINSMLRVLEMALKKVKP